jgi:tRNA 2-(methylsulfanyl)-N6-isopentenyladenosine37 hydroxylase
MNKASLRELINPIVEFLPCPTPQAWLGAALDNQRILLIDHANCEKKAAATAMNLMYRHTTLAELLSKMSQLAREELLHFQQVVELMAGRNIAYVRLGPSRYAGEMLAIASGRHHERLIDTLIIGAFIEARSCERFASLLPLLDDELERFYRSLLKSESRHFQDYLSLAQLYSKADIGPRVEEFARLEQRLIESEDSEFRFHSGPPV